MSTKLDYSKSSSSAQNTNNIIYRTQTLRIKHPSPEKSNDIPISEIQTSVINPQYLLEQSQTDNQHGSSIIKSSPNRSIEFGARNNQIKHSFSNTEKNSVRDLKDGVSNSSNMVIDPIQTVR